jgi:hypothetical protein
VRRANRFTALQAAALAVVLHSALGNRRRFSAVRELTGLDS